MKQTRKKPKLKICKVCPKSFLQYDSLVVWCSPECGYKLSKIKSKQSYDKETKRLTREYRANKRSYQMRKAQDRCNEYIRLRDRGLPCISCGTNSTRVQFAAGHWKSIGSHPELRFHPFNISRQCNRNCNLAKSGNSAMFRNGLIERIGLKNVEWLESSHQPQNLTLDDIKGVNLWYKERIKHLNITGD